MFAPKGICPAVLALAVGFGSAAAFADDATTQQMQQQITQLESQVQKLEAQQNQSQTQNQSEAATMNAIAADANSQSKFLAPVMSASGYDSATGFHLASEDGNYFLHPWILFQFRGDINDRQSIPTGGGGASVPATGSTETDGFEIHNLMFGINGHIISPNLQYYFMVDAPSLTGNPLQDAYATYRFGDNCPWMFKAGQFVDPVWHESNVDDGHLLLVDRSLAGVFLGGNTGLNNIAERVQGVGVGYTSEMMRGEFDLTDGYATANTPFYNTAVAEPGSPTAAPPAAVNFGMSARFEYSVLGDDNAWNQYNSLAAADVKSDSLVLGGGAEWTEADVYDNVYLTVDGQYTNPCGLNVYGAFLENYADWTTAPASAISGTYSNFGFIAQVGFMLTPRIEPFARYDLAVLDGRYAEYLSRSAVHTDDNHEITVGVNYYLYDYRAKVSGDISFLPNGSDIDAPGLGVLADQNHSEWVGRVQFQLSI